MARWANLRSSRRNIVANNKREAERGFRVSDKQFGRRLREAWKVWQQYCRLRCGASLIPRDGEPIRVVDEHGSLFGLPIDQCAALLLKVEATTVLPERVHRELADQRTRSG